MQVLVPVALRSYTPALQVAAEGHAPFSLLVDRNSRHPGLRFRVIDAKDQLRSNMHILVSGRDVRDLDHALAPDDFVADVLARSGH